MPRHYGALIVADPPEELPEYVSTRNESYATLKCLVWDRDALPSDGAPDGSSGRHFDILPAVIPKDTRPSALRMRKRKPPAEARPSTASHANVFGGDESATPLKERHGVRTLATTRAIVGSESFLESTGKEFTVGHGGVAKPETKMWGWQRVAGFDLRHEDAGVERSKLQIRQDAEREVDRKRRRAFNAHLRKEAMYRPVNRIGLRHDSPQRQIRQATGFKADGGPRAAAVPQPPMGCPPPSAEFHRAASARHASKHRGYSAAPQPPGSSLSSRDAHPSILSPRVRQKIASMADEFLCSRPPSGSRRGAPPSAPPPQLTPRGAL